MNNILWINITKNKVKAHEGSRVQILLCSKVQVVIIEMHQKHGADIHKQIDINF